MATLTTNLFRGNGPRSSRLTVTSGRWPQDMHGDVYIVGPDKRSAGGHWFGERGLVMRIACQADENGRIPVYSRTVRTPVLRLRDRHPRLFRRLAFADLSPLGFTNLANTNVEAFDGRLFLGYDAGRQIEIDPDTLDYLTAVGSNGEWFHALPAPFEPMISIAAHPAVDHAEHAMYFVNYSPIPSPDGSAVAFLARWNMRGQVERWPLEGVPAVDSIHDVKATSDHLVFSDLPFAAGPETVSGAPRSTPNQDFTRLFIVAKADLRSRAPGQPVPITMVQLAMPTGHLMVDVDETDGCVTVQLEHIPLSDLMIMLRSGETTHSGSTVDPDHEGLIALGVQPGVVGRYVIDPSDGTVVESDVIWDDRFWGPVLATRDRTTAEARARGGQIWFAGVGFDPDLVSEEWWRLYGDGAGAHLVAPVDLPTNAVPAALARFDLDAGKVADLHQFAPGEFASPPQFVPRVTSERPGDGYIVAMVHRDGAKQVQVFDADHLEHGPLATAEAADFAPPLLLHSAWLGVDRPRRPAYAVSRRSDLLGALRQLPSRTAGVIRSGRALSRQTPSVQTLDKQTREKKV